MEIIDRAVAAYERGAAAARRRFGLVDHVWSAVERFGEVVAGRLAAAISYYGFFAAFALAVVVYSILGRALSTDQDGLIGRINEYLSANLPWVVDTAAQVGQRQVTTLGLVALVLTGVGWVEALRSSQRAVWLLDQHPGHWFIRRVVDLAVLVALGLLLGLSLAMTALLDAALGWIAPDTTFGTMLVRASGPVLAFGVNLILAAATLMALPRLRLSPRRLLLPTVVVAVGIQLLNSVGAWFIARTEHRPAYQFVTNAVGLLIYLYLLNQLILFGAALAATSRHGTMVDLGAKARESTVPAGGLADDLGEPPGTTPHEPR